MDFCNRNETVKILGVENREGVEYVKVSYSYFCPFLLFACFVSVLLNGLLVIVRRSPMIRKTPIIVMSLNLATTDGLVSLISVIGITLNSYLPVVYGITFNSCFLLILEILRLSAFVASVLHLLVLTWLHYQGIVNPLEHRLNSVFNNEGNISHAITAISWILPLTIFTAYFWCIPCQGFRSESCDFLFLLTLKFRLIVILFFGIPLIFMVYAYIKIFYVLSFGQDQFGMDTNVQGKNRITQSYWKAIITSLIIVGTYIVCWMPAVTWFALTCVDSCPFPLLQLSMTTRLVFGFITNTLVVAKAIVDPFIYCFRMKEIHTALTVMFNFYENSDQRNNRFSMDSPMNTIHTKINRSVGDLNSKHTTV